jgi:hypothetical protein
MKWEDIKTYADAVAYKNEQDLYTSINGFDTEEEAEIGIPTVEEICKIKDIHIPILKHTRDIYVTKHPLVFTTFKGTI